MQERLTKSYSNDNDNDVRQCRLHHRYKTERIYMQLEEAMKSLALSHTLSDTVILHSIVWQQRPSGAYRLHPRNFDKIV